MPRIAPVSPPYSDEVQASFAKLMPPDLEPLTLFRTLAHNPRVLRRVQRGGLLDPGSIPLRLRELAILRTCRLCGADYEWGVHAALFGSAAGLADAALDADPATGDWSDDERLVLALCDELHATSTVSDALWSSLSERFDPAQLVELLVLAGLYHAVSYVANACRIDAEPWARQR